MAEPAMTEPITTPSQPTTAVEPSASSPPPSPEPQPSTTPASPDASTTPAVPVAPSAPSWLEQLRSSGVDLGTDETRAREQLAQMYRERQQLQPILPYAQAYAQHAPQFSAWLRQQQGQAAPAQAPAGDKKWYSEFWNPPEYNQGWERLVIRDPQTGALSAAPGAPPDIVPKVAAYAQYRQEFAERFLSNPPEALEPMVKALARREAEQIVREQLSQQTETSSSQQYVQQNRDWLYEKDANGTPKTTQTFNPMTGQMVNAPVLSQWGNYFKQCVEQEQYRQHQRGYQDVNEQRQFAEARVQQALLAAEVNRLRSAGQSGVGGSTPSVPVQQPVSPNEAFLRANNPPSNTPPTRGNSNTKEKPVNRFNLEQMMRQDFAANGITGQVTTTAL